MTALAGPMANWGEKECSSVMKQALAAQGWPDGGPRMPPIKVNTMSRTWTIQRQGEAGEGVQCPVLGR